MCVRLKPSGSTYDMHERDRVEDTSRKAVGDMRWRVVALGNGIMRFIAVVAERHRGKRPRRFTFGQVVPGKEIILLHARLKE